MDLFQASHITKQYDNRTIIRDISIHLERRELVSLLGVSGTGKTTLFQILSGLVSPDEGEVLLNGENITSRPGRVSYMFQKDLLLPHKKVIDNVSLPLVLKGQKTKETSAGAFFRMLRQKKEERKAAHPFFSVFGLDGTQYQFPSQLSGGMRQRAALLRTYLSASEVALLDEPFSALDTITKGQMHDWYLDIMEKIELSTFLITHDIDEAILLSDRIYLMTGKPGMIQNEITVERPRSQRAGFELTEEFLNYKRRIIEIIKD